VGFFVGNFRSSSKTVRLLSILSTGTMHMPQMTPPEDSLFSTFEVLHIFLVLVVNCLDLFLMSILLEGKTICNLVTNYPTNVTHFLESFPAISATVSPLSSLLFSGEDIAHHSLITTSLQEIMILMETFVFM